MATEQSPDLIINQLKTLSEIHSKDFVNIDRSIRLGLNALELESVHQLYAVGDGDSYHAAISTELSFNEFAQIPYFPISAMHFLEYGVDYIQTNNPRDTIVLGISASGSSIRVLQSIEKAKRVNEKLLTASLVGKDDSPIGKAGDKLLSIQIPDFGRSPGVRTYAASLMGLMSLAIRIGEQKRHYHMEEANELRNEIVNMADVVNDTYLSSLEPAVDAAKLCQSAPFISFVGSGPSFGTACFSAAKVVEASGVFAVAQDTEEWAHVERFAYPVNYPVVIIAPPGKGYLRAVDLAKGAKALGHPIIAIIDRNDIDIKTLADITFPVIGEIRESFSPLLYYISGTCFAYSIAKLLKRSLFMTDNLNIMQAIEAFQKQIQG